MKRVTDTAFVVSYTADAIAVLDGCFDDNRPSDFGGHLSSDGDGLPLYVLPPGNGVSWRKLDFSRL